MSEVSKPFAHWESFSACVVDQRSLGHSEESAKKICGAIQDRAEKGMLYKTAEMDGLEVLKASGNDLIVGGPASWDVVDPANDWVTVKAHQKFMEKFFKLPAKYRNMSIDHTSLIMGEPLLKYPEENPRYFSHVHEKGMYLISKVRDDSLSYVREYRDKILNREYRMYSIRGKALNPEVIQKDGRAVRKIDDIDPIEVAYVREGMCPMPKIEVLKEKTMEKESAFLEKATKEELEQALLAKYQERDALEAVLYPPMKISSEAPTGFNDADKPVPPDPALEYARQQLRNKLSILRIEIYGLEEALKQKIIAINKAKKEVGELQPEKEVKSTVISFDAESIIRKHFKSPV